MELKSRLGFLAACISIWMMPAHGQSSPRARESSMQRHYDAAYRLQSAGNLAASDREHTAFLSEALSKLANGYANIGDYAKAGPIYDEALMLSPEGFPLLRDYAAASIDAHAFDRAKTLLSTALSLPNLEPKSLAGLHRIMGDADLGLRGKSATVEEFETAVSIDPSCENVYALANAQLAVTGPSAATSTFSRYVTQCGDSPASHLAIGRSYALIGFPDEAVREFKEVIEQNPRYPEAHYCLGAAYVSSAKTNFDLAEAELKKELELHPDDRYSYAQLGHIALMRNQTREAEAEYRHAVAANPRDPANFIQLGQILSDQHRNAEAEPLLRKAIELTADPARDNFAVERAHYLLGRLLSNDGKKDEAQRELKVAEDLLNLSRHGEEARLKGVVDLTPLAKTHSATNKEIQENLAFVRQVSPLVAGSYNNLGVHAAMAGNFEKAAHYFEAASQWNPSLPGVDMNWGRAAFFAHEWRSAIGPLERALISHPDDAELNGMLAECRRQTASAN